MNPKLLVITDHPEYPQIKPQLLVLSGMEVSVQDQIVTSDESSATTLAYYNLILIHLLGHESDSAAVCQQLRPHYANPLLVILKEKDEKLMLRVYDAGADDCLVQPMNSRLLLAIVNAWLRRAPLRS